MSVVEHPASKNKSGPAAGTAEPQLSEERIDEIRQRLRKHLNDNGEVTQAEVSRAISYSTAAVAQFLSDSYRGNLSNIGRAIDRHLDLYEQQRSIGAQPHYVKTSTVKKIERAIFMAQATRGIAIVATQTGVGLTMAFAEYVRRFPLSVQLQCSPEMDTRWPLLSELLAVLGRHNRRPAEARRDIVEAITGTDRMLLIDESHYLSQECVDIIRRIHDQAGVPVVFGGNESTYQGFKTRSSGSMNRGMGAMAYTQLRGRLAARVQLRAERHHHQRHPPHRESDGAERGDRRRDRAAQERGAVQRRPAARRPRSSHGSDARAGQGNQEGTYLPRDRRDHAALRG
jgi:DNA transposition AAA+ family ATPase